MYWVWLFLAVILLGSLADNFLGPRTFYAGYPVYESSRSPTGYAVTRRYYDMQTGNVYHATTPVVVASVNTRRPRGTINYGGYSHPAMGIQPRSY